MQLRLPLFSLIYFCLSWLFIGIFAIFLLYHAFYKNNYQSAYLSQGYVPAGAEAESVESEEEDELQAFL